MSMNSQEMLRILDSIARDRSIERSVLIADLEQAMVSAARKHFSTIDADEFTCSIDPISGQMELLRRGEAVSMQPQEFGRIAAQTFKQVMIQRFRDDERHSILEEFSKRVGEIVTGTAQRYEGGALVVTVDRAEAFMPRSEQIPGEQFAPGDRVRCLILDVRWEQVRSCRPGAEDFIKRLFGWRCPGRRADHRVKAMAREAGTGPRSRCLRSTRRSTRWACVGVRGSRIKEHRGQLNGKIDIVAGTSRARSDPELAEAGGVEESRCASGRACDGGGPRRPASLAIGKRGQNVRLAARLTGWDIDISRRSSTRA